VSPSLSALVFGLVAAGAVGLAVLLALRGAGFTRQHSPLFAAFAGGLVVTLAVVELIPSALSSGGHAPWLVLAGFAGGFVLQGLTGGSAVASVSAGPGSARARAAALAAVGALAIHSALDGVIFAVTHALEPALAATAGVGLVAHQLPVAVVCFILLQRAGLGDRLAAWLAFAAAGLTMLAAAVATAPFAAALDTGPLTILMALVAGLLLHVGAAHLLSEALAAGLLRGGGAVFAGAGAAAVMLMGHDHAHHDHAHGGDIHHGPGAHRHNHAHDDAHDHDHDHANPHEHHLPQEPNR
jgi:zinc transporter ZupT